MATLFGFDETEWRDIFLGFLTPMLGFVFAYLLNLELKSIPWIQNVEGVAVPRWMLPSLAYVSVFLAVFSAVAVLYLRYAVAYPNMNEFERRYLTSIEKIFDGENSKIDHIKFEILKYSAQDHVQIYFNNRLIFGDHWNCIAKYQCLEKIKNNRGIFPKMPENIERRRFPVDRSYGIPLVLEADGMPYQFEPSSLLVIGRNRIDVTLARSGLNDPQKAKNCHLEVDVTLLGKSGIQKRAPIHLSPMGFSTLQAGSIESCKKTGRLDVCNRTDSYQVCDRKSYTFILER
jgi:hypothetical protein